MSYDALSVVLWAWTLGAIGVGILLILTGLGTILGTVGVVLIILGLISIMPAMQRSLGDLSFSSGK